MPSYKVSSKPALQRKHEAALKAAAEAMFAEAPLAGVYYADSAKDSSVEQTVEIVVMAYLNARQS